MTTETVQIPVSDPNARFRVLTIKYREPDAGRREVYLLNPGDNFALFGGHRNGLTVRKTASLIIRDIGPAGCRDFEHNVNDPTAWDAIRISLTLPGITIS